MELENIVLVTGLGFLLALVFGAVANKTNFCTMGGISDWVNMGLTGRMGAWVLAMGIAIAGTQILELTGMVDIQSSIYRTTTFGLLGYVLGGVLFGIGMTLAGGCGQRTLVKVGNGSMKSLVVAIVLGLTAYMTLRGILAVIRVDWIDPFGVDLAASGVADQGLASLLAHWFGFADGDGLRWGLALGIAGLLMVLALSQRALRNDFNNLLAGIMIGLIVICAWVITGLVGQDDFDPVPVEGLTFVAPTGNTISYLMTYTGATINFGIAVVLGIIAGSFLYGLVTRSLRLETFNDRQDMLNHLGGAVLMGFGGVLSFGCTVGQGISGVSTLAVGSFIALFSIIFGSMMTIRVQYYRMDDRGWANAFFTSLADTLLPWRRTE